MIERYVWRYQVGGKDRRLEIEVFRQDSNVWVTYYAPKTRRSKEVRMSPQKFERLSQRWEVKGSDFCGFFDPLDPRDPIWDYL